MKAGFFQKILAAAAFSFLLLSWGCVTPGEGYLTFRLVWPTPAHQTAVAENKNSLLIAHRSATGFRPQADYLQVVTVRASLWDGDNMTKTYNHAYGDHRGHMNVPVGTYLLRLEGLDDKGQVRYKAEKNPVKIANNKTTDLGEIQMEDQGLPVTVLPAVPSNLQVTGVSSSRIDLSWSDNSDNEEGFILERTEWAGGIFLQIADLAAGTGTYTDANVICGQDYYYKVVAYNGAGRSDYSNEILASTVSCPHLPAAPSGLYAEAVTSTEIKIVWTDNSDNEEGFSIFRKTGETGSYQRIISTGAGQTGYLDRDLKCITTYYYKISAYNDLGYSEYSNEISATTDVCWRAVQADGGEYHTCAVTEKGGVRCWGSNEYGQLGKGWKGMPAGQVEVAVTPADVVGLESGVRDASTGSEFSCALTDEGGIKCWGKNDQGQLGDGSNETKYTPVDVSGLTSGIQEISVGYVHACAVTDAGGVKCWGQNAYGQLGDKSFVNRNYPVDVVSLGSGVKMVSAGGNDTCALTNEGGVKCWGRDYGDQQRIPMKVKGLDSGVVAISAGGDHTCSLSVEGGVKCWGADFFGQLGDNYNQDSTVPVQVMGLTSGVTEISTGISHSCALTEEGKVKCWGYNVLGQLGDGTRAWKYAPIDVIGLNSKVVGIYAGENHTCALTSKGALKCWGSNLYGQLGSNLLTPSFNSYPSSESTIPLDVSQENP